MNITYTINIIAVPLFLSQAPFLIDIQGNIATAMRQFGIIIDQSYPNTLANPGKSVVISAVNSGGSNIAVNCGAGSCEGIWNWSNLDVSGGVSGPILSIHNFAGISGLSL